MIIFETNWILEFLVFTVTCLGLSLSLLAMGFSFLIFLHIANKINRSRR